MKAADTRASSAIADWTPLTVVPRSRTTAEMETFIMDVSTTRTNMAMASKMASRRLNGASCAAAPDTVSSVIWSITFSGAVDERSCVARPV